MSTNSIRPPDHVRMEQPAPAPGGVRSHHIALLFLAYFVIAFLFHAAGINVFSSLVGAGDGHTAGLPSKLFAVHLSPWNPLVQLGQYSFANTQFQPFYPPALLIMMMLPDTFGYNLFILSHYALAGLFFCLFARNRGVRPPAAFVGGLLFMLSGFLSAHKGHQAMMSAAVWLPLMLLFLDRYLDSGHLRELAGTALALAFSLLAGFPQVTAYSIPVTAVYFLYRSRPSGGGAARWLVRAFGALGAVGLLAILLSSLQLLAVAEALPEMTREKLTYEMFSQNYLPVYHILALIIPNFFGGFYNIGNYSPEFNTVEVYGYMGLLPLALAYAAVRYYRGRKNGEALLWTSVAAVAFLLAIGQTTPLQAVMFRVPVYNLFRAPARHLFEVDFAIAVLATLGLDLLFRSAEVESLRLRAALLRASRALALVFFLVYVLSQAARAFALWYAAIPGHPLDGLAISPVMSFAAARGFIVKSFDPAFSTVLYPTLFFGLSFAVLRIGAGRKMAKLLAPAVAVLIVADVYMAYSSLYPAPDTSALGHPEARPDTAFLAAQKFDKDAYRIFTLDQDLINTYPLLNMTYGWSAVNDYTPMWLKRYVTMTDFGPNGAMPAENLQHPNVLAAAGARYLIARSPVFTNILKSVASYRASDLRPVLADPPMTLDRATATGHGAYLLRSGSGASDVSLLQTPIALQKSTRYHIAFTVRAAAGLPKPLLVNLYGGAGYDNSAQYAVFYQAPAVATPITAVIDSGPAAPAQAYVRIFTQSVTPVEISDVRVSMLNKIADDAVTYRPIYTGTDGATIFLNPGALPRFRFAQHLRPCRDASEARSVLDSDTNFNVSTDALVEGLAEPITVPPGEILSRRVENNRLEFRLKTGDRAFFVVGDSWFPGWKARVDGRDEPILVVDGFLRGVLLAGAGTHDLEMIYRPWSVPVGVAATLFGLLIVGGAFWKGDLAAFRARGDAGRSPSPRSLGDVDSPVDDHPSPAARV